MDKARKKNNRIIRIRLIDGTTINGQVNINQEKGYDRLSDLLKSTGEEFIILNSATVNQRELETPIKHLVLFVNKAHILWCGPDEDQK